MSDKVTLDRLKSAFENMAVEITEDKEDESFSIEFENGNILYLSYTPYYSYFLLFDNKEDLILHKKQNSFYNL